MKRLIITLAALATATSGFAEGNISSFTGFPQGTTWNEFVQQMDKEGTAKDAFVAGLDLAALGAAPTANILSWLADPTSAKLATALTNETGSGTVVFSTSPTLVTPVLGVATATSINGVTITSGQATDPQFTSVDVNSGAIVMTGTSINIDSLGEVGVNISLPNDGKLSWEAAPAGSDITLKVNSSEQFVFSAEILNPTNVGQVVKTGLTASGSAANTFAGSTGTFLTSSGANTLSGDVTVAANKNITLASGTGATDASAASGIWKTSTGLNTVGGKQALKVIATPVAATGSDVSGAAALGSANILTISSDSAAKGVIAVAGVAGDVVHLINTSSTAAILYPATGGTINGLSANAGVVIPASKGLILICTATNTWFVFDLTARATAA